MDRIREHQKMLRRKWYLEGGAKAKKRGGSNLYRYMDVEYDWYGLQAQEAMPWLSTLIRPVMNVNSGEQTVFH